MTSGTVTALTFNSGVPTKVVTDRLGDTEQTVQHAYSRELPGSQEVWLERASGQTGIHASIRSA